MRRVAAILVASAAVAVLALGTGAGETDRPVYKVRAIFHNAFSVIPGEDVKVAGVRVGSIDSLDVTDDHKAAVVLKIDDPGFQDFRADAECTIRPQSLIGEKFVECVPTQPRTAGATAQPPLRKIDRGEGKGQFLLPATQTSRPIDIDLVNNVLRLPYRERLSIILNELGTGLAARGADLNAAIRSANPALKELDKVLQILSKQNRTLRALARDGDEILQPLARERSHVADFVVQANRVSQATAERRADLELNLQKLPGFLRELRPTMQRLGSLSEQAAPVARDLNRAGPAVSTFIRQLGPFSEAAIPAVQTLGDAADVGRRALVAGRPIVKDIRSFATEARPLAANLSAALTSLRDTGGIERLMDYVFFQVAAVNGFDSLGHYLRAILVVNLCSTYATQRDPGCSANFSQEEASTRARIASKPTLADVERQIAAGRSPYLARMDAVLRGLDPALLSRKPQRARGKGEAPAQDDALNLPPALLPGQDGGTQPAQAAPAQQPAPAGQDQNSVQTLLEYLLGPPR